MKTRQIRLSVAQWIALPAHPRQRPTERHAIKAAKHHLSAPHPAHAHVTAVMFDGVMYKADGHTRAYLWEKGDLASPTEKLFVTVYDCGTIEEANSVYDTFDNAKASEDVQDRLGGAYAFLGIDATNPLMRDGMPTAFGLLGAPTDQIAAIEAWRPELELLSQVVSGKGKMGGVMVAAALASFRVHGAKVLPLWNKYRRGEVNAINGSYCPIGHMTRDRAELPPGSYSLRRMGVQNILGNVERWVRSPDGRTKMQAVPVDLKSYLNGTVAPAPKEEQRGKAAQRLRNEQRAA